MGQNYIKTILDNEIEITEKIDGSSFSFGKVGGVIYCRSKRAILYGNASDQMFGKAIDYVHSIQDRLQEGIIYHAEYLQKPKHNAIKYERVPKNHLALYGVKDHHTGSFVSNYGDLSYIANNLGIDVAPLIYYGRLSMLCTIKSLIERKSYLGDVNIEGVVVKNYQQSMHIGDVFFPIMCGKFVSEEFKEQASDWKKEHTNVGQWEAYKLSYRTEARWDKAIQHLRDDGLLQVAPQDIGPLIKEVQRDIADECKEDIKEFLWNHFGKEILRISTHGLPEYYKEKLLEG